MIVFCSGCQARFRVADEKIGPRGAKVRCSKCGHMFVVKREPAPPPPPRIELDLTPGLPRPAPVDPFAQAMAGGSVLPFSAAVQPRPKAPDPFAAAGLDAFPGPAPAVDDPFVRASPDPVMQAPPPPAPAGTGAAIEGERPASAAIDPFAPPALQDPLPAAAASRTPSLPVTDLAQLLGAASAAAVPPAAPAKDAFPVSAPDFPADLALEDGGTPGKAAPFADPADVFATADLSGSGSAAFESGLAGPIASSGESLALATEPTPVPPEPSTGAQAAAPAAEEEPAPRAAPPVPAVPRPPPDLESDAALPTRAAPRTADRVRAAAVSALALVALLAIALFFRVVLRGEAALGPSALRPSTLLRALGGARTPEAQFEVADARTGLYEQAGGETVLLVRGEVISRALGEVRGVRIEAELVRDGQVLARGEASAGAVPTAEEVYEATGRTALAGLAAEAGKRAPRLVAPGDRLAFLVALGELPADLSGTTVRVRAEPAGEAPR